MEIQVTRCSAFEKTTQKELFAYATFITVDGKRKLTDISLKMRIVKTLNSHI